MFWAIYVTRRGLSGFHSYVMCAAGSRVRFDDVRRENTFNVVGKIEWEKEAQGEKHPSFCLRKCC